MQETRYDVTGVTETRDYVPIATTTTKAQGEDLARRYSREPAFNVVYVKIARSGAILTTYVRGKRQPS